MNKGIPRFLLKALLFSLPMLGLTVWYFVDDPFRVLRKYESFYPPDNQYVILNRDYVSTELFLKNNPKQHYEAFIFGSSRSLFYRAADWEKHIHTHRIFHFDASSETLFGIYSKLKYLDEQKIPIHHALIVMDYTTLTKTTDSPGHILTKHPLTAQKNEINFQIEFLKAFWDMKFLIPYLDLKISGKFKGYMGVALQSWNVEFDETHNEISHPHTDEQIAGNREAYYQSKMNVIFYKRDTITRFSPTAIQEEQQKMLREIQGIFLKNRTQLKIVINPLYDQTRLNPKDLQALKSIFGETVVYDFSGINDLTQDVYNYYETSHYRPHVATEIMNRMYAGQAE
jgi:hypothetical protein